LAVVVLVLLVAETLVMHQFLVLFLPLAVVVAAQELTVK
jgi:hypothetical protein